MRLNLCSKCDIDRPAAFDMVRDPMVALETLVSLGFQRVLTSGCDTSALEGLPLIKRLIDQVCIHYMCPCISACKYCFYVSLIATCSSTWQAKGRIVIVPGENIHYSLELFLFFLHCIFVLFNIGGGITERNLQRILEGSGAQEFHCSARSSKDSGMKFRFAEIQPWLVEKMWVWISNSDKGFNSVAVVPCCLLVQEHLCVNGSCFLSTWVWPEGGRCEQSSHAKCHRQKYLMIGCWPTMEGNHTDTSKVSIYIESHSIYYQMLLGSKKVETLNK